MDPITAIGVASGILSFLTVGVAVLKVGYGVIVTSDGLKEQNMTREVVFGDTNAFLDQLMPSDDPRLQDDKGLGRLVKESRRIAEKMIETLEEVKPTSSRTVANLRSAFQRVLSQPDMEDLEKRMDQCRSQLDLYLNSEYFKNLKSSLDELVDEGRLTRSQLSRMQSSVNHLRSVIESFRDQVNDQARLLIGVQQESLDRICQRVVLKALRFPEIRDRSNAVDPAHERSFRWLLSEFHDYDFGSDLSSSDYQSSSSDSQTSVEDVAESDDEVVAETEDESFAALDYDEPRRSASIGTLTSATTQTALPEEGFDGEFHDKTELFGQESEHPSSMQDSPSSHDLSLDTDDREYSDEEEKTAQMRELARDKFLHWLSSSNEIFHICGKLGSGKSTLMKFILEHDRTKAELQAWAEDRQLVCASFFFWKPGSKLQKSLPGLCRSLLHDVLAARPELTQSVLPKIWALAKDHPHPIAKIEPPTPKDVQKAFENLIQNQNLYTHHRFCFFIDGLDEYEETGQQDHKSMVNMLNSWTQNSNGNVKLCVSSREYNVFMNAYCDDRRLRVHDLTLYDIRRYVQDRLNYLRDNAAEQELQELVHDVACRANGIFLWATLVVKTMIEAIEDGGSVASLPDLLNSSPTELEELFHHILEKLNKEKLEKAFKTFAILDRIDHASSSKQVDSKYLPKLSLLAYSFLDEYARDQRFAIRDERWDAIELGAVTAKERVQTAAKQLSANCKGLLEARKTPDNEDEHAGPLINYTHRSVYDYLEQLRSSKKPGFVLLDENFDAGDAASNLILAQIRMLGPEFSDEHDYAGLAILRFAGMAVPDQDPYEFLECIDSLTGKAGFHEPTGYGDRNLRINCGGGYGYEVHPVLIPGTTGPSLTSPNEVESGTPCTIDRPIFVAISYGFNDYVAWKLRHDPGVVDTSLKRMVLVDCFSEVMHPGDDHLLLDFLVNTQSFPRNETSGFLQQSMTEGGKGFWDTTQCAWFSVWRQTLVSVAISVLSHASQDLVCAWIPKNSERVGQILEELLRRGAADEEMEIVVTFEDDWMVRLIFRFGEACLTWSLISDAEGVFTHGRDGERISNITDWEISYWMSNSTEADVIDIDGGEEMRITFREFIRAIELPNQDVLFSLLDSQIASRAPAEATAVEEMVETDEVFEVLLPESVQIAETVEARTTAQSLWGRVDAELALTFGTGVLVSLVVVSVWAKYSLGVRGHS